METKQVVGIIASAFIALIVLIMGIKSTESIKAGHAGVVYNPRAGLEKDTLGPGWHLVWFWKTVTEYPVSTETVYLSKSSKEGSKEDDSFNISTKEGKPVNVDAYYSFRVEQEKLPQLFNRFKGASIESIENGYIKSILKSTVQAHTSEYSITEVQGEKRTEITNKIKEDLKKELETVGINLETFSFGEIRPDEATSKSIQAKVDAQQQLEKTKIDLEQQKLIAEKQRVEAQGNADKARIEAEGQAKANQLLQQTLTPDLVQYKIAEKWNGVQPSTLVTGSNGNFIQIPTVPSK